MMDVIDLSLELLYVDPLNPRSSLDEDAVVEIAESIAEHGVDQPLQVRPGRDGMYGVLSGSTRLAAAERAGLGSVPCVVRADLDDLDARLLAVRENTARRTLTVTDEARAYRALVDAGMSQQAVADQCGTNTSRVSQALQLLTFPQDVQDAVDAGSMGLGRAVKQHSTHPTKSTGQGLPRGKAARRAVTIGATTALHVPTEAAQDLLCCDSAGLGRLVDAGLLDIHPQTGGIPLVQVVEAARKLHRPMVDPATWMTITNDAHHRGMTTDEWLRRALVSLGVASPVRRRPVSPRYAS